MSNVENQTIHQIWNLLDYNNRREATTQIFSHTWKQICDQVEKQVRLQVNGKVIHPIASQVVVQTRVQIYINFDRN